MLVLVLLAASAHSALSGGSDSITNALVLVVTIAGWSYAVDWLGYRFRPVRRMLRPEPLPLITDGQLIHRNMARESVTEDELRAQLRLQGVDDIANVRRAFLESDGQVSVIRNEAPTRPHARRRRTHA